MKYLMDPMVAVGVKAIGSRKVTALLRDGDWTDEELDPLRAELDRVRKERKS